MSEDSLSATGRPSDGTGATPADRGRPDSPGTLVRRSVPSPTYSREIARIELHRGYRWLRGQDFWVAFTAVMGVIGVFLFWVTFDAARGVGTALAGGASAPTWLVTGTSVVWLFLTVLLVGDGMGTNSDLDNDGHYLTMRPAADVVGGLYVAAVCKFSVYTLGLGVAVALGLALGTGSLLPPVGVVAAAVVAAVTTAAVGYPVGFALKGLVRRSRGLGRIKGIVGVVLVVAYVTLSVTGGMLTIVDELEPVLLAPPLAWLGDLALVTTPGAGADVTGALATLALAPLLVLSGVVLSIPAARYAWTADVARADGSDDEATPTAPDRRLDAILGAVCRDRATVGVASTTLVRAVRSPFQFVFVAPPLLAAIPLVDGVVSTGAVPWYAPWFVVWYGTWAAGAVVPLNPLGNQGATLPALLTAPARGRHVVDGHVVAAALPVAPLTAGLAVAAGSLAGSPGPELVALAVAGVAAVVVGAILAAGIGAVFPRFDAVDLTGARRAVPPSKLAYSLFSTLLTVLVGATAVAVDDTAREVTALLLSAWLPLGPDVGTGAVIVLGWSILVAGVVSVPVAYWIAVRRVDAYRLH